MKLTFKWEIFVKFLSQLQGKHIDNYFFVAKYLLARSMFLKHKRPINYQNIDTVEPVNNGHPRDRSKWSLCTGDRYRQVVYNMGSL